VSRVRALGHDTFRSLRRRNYRLYFAGQIVSVSGTWMQSLAQAWLVLELTGSGVSLGVTAALQFLPMLVAGSWGGLVADRFDKRRLLLGTQVAAATLALALGLITAFGAAALWNVYLLAFLLGCVTVVDNPARQTFVLEMVGPDDLPNAVGLNSVVMNASRAVGPALGGVLIGTLGVTVCFFVNAASYAAVVAALLAMDTGQLRRRPGVAREPGQLRAGYRYVWAHRALRAQLLMMALIGTLAFNFHVVLPLLATRTFGLGAGGYGGLTSALGVGAVVGGLAAASRRTQSARRLVGLAAMFGVALVLAAVAPTLPLAVVALVVTGAAAFAYVATANTALQLTAAADMRGRVMALYAIAFLGSTPIGSPIVGWVAERFGPRAALLLGAAAVLGAAALGAYGLLAGRAPRPRLVAGPGDEVEVDVTAAKVA
jgi:predicted MFS family arabinose efflux permease